MTWARLGVAVLLAGVSIAATIAASTVGLVYGIEWIFIHFLSIDEHGADLRNATEQAVCFWQHMHDEHNRPDGAGRAETYRQIYRYAYDAEPRLCIR